MDERSEGPPKFPAPETGVSVVMPVLNEAGHLAEAVGSILAQDYAGPLEVVIALGPSTDGTDEIAASLIGTDPRVRSVPNPSGLTPDGLNAAIDATTYDVIMRSDGHCVMPSDYVRTAVATLVRTNADNVGGVMAAEGQTTFERAVARAMTSRLGVGGASFHVGGVEGEAETVYLGVFRRSALDRVGGYDPTFLRAQDWEMNHRIRATGGLVWFTPDLVVAYRPRPSLGRLARQYFDYGRWRRVVMRRHPETVTRSGAVRYLAAPAAVTAVLGGTVLGIIGSTSGPGWLRIGWLAPLGYAAGIVVGSAVTGRGLPPGAWMRLPIVYATMHGSWGVGFLTSPRDLGSPRG